ncbi:E3 ubiquitin-protein ligase Topors [Xylocopa sonorina]|uniref:E3 ubiquitin-protein ligase Topors n=1 Tax=Xylocopa sonorina TaxID=1818115 RepID=UPI00403AF893
MEGSLEVKDSPAAAGESIKSEAPIQNPDSSDRSDGAVSPPPNCSICLGKLVNTSFTDSCLHQFCFTCLLQWSKIKTECPLCKQTFKSIIHNVRSEEDYDQYHVPRELATFEINFDGMGHAMDAGTRRFHYRTTMTGHHHRSLHELVLNPEQVARREQLPSIAPQVPMGERLRRRANPADYRRTIYSLGIWATGIPDVFDRFRECSADFYRREPRELNRLIPWLNRELQVLLSNNASHVAYVLRAISNALVQYDIRSLQFRDIVRPHFGTFTDHFVHELLNYARTNFDLVGYDQYVTYLPQGLSNEYVSNVLSPTSSSTSTSSDDSDVRVLDEAIDLRMNTEIPSVGPHAISMPGPSTVGQTFQMEIPYNVPHVLTISSDSSSSDNDCEIIGYVKLRHERTPEVIELVSSDPEEINISDVSNDNAQTTTPASYENNAQPSTSHSIKKEDLRVTPNQELTSSSSESDSDSERNRKCRSRTRKHTKRSTTARRRIRSIETKSRNRTSRNLSSSGESDVRKRETKRSSQRMIKRRLSSSSSDDSFHEMEPKPMDEKKSSASQYSTKGSVRYRRELIKESHRKESRYKDDRQSVSRSSSESSYASQKEKRIVSWRRDLSDDDNWITRYSSRKDRGFKSKARKWDLSSSDYDEDFRSHSQCSNYSSKSYTHKKKSKHKDRRKNKKRKRSNSRTHSSSNKSRLTRRHPA